MLREPSYGGLAEQDGAERAMYRSIASLTDLNNPRLYKALHDHFAAVYPVSAKTGASEFHLGGGQTFRLHRGLNDLSFEITYSDISRFAAVTRSLNSRTKKYAKDGLQWSTSRVASPRQLLALPRPLDEPRAPEDVLMSIFHLDLNDSAETERRITTCIAALYPSGPRLGGGQQSNDAQATMSNLADWLSFQDVRQILQVDDAGHAATMLISMMFGGFASRMSAGEGLPDRASLIGYMKSCIQLFVRGCRRHDA
ncbi:MULTISPECIES: hypothetical protein [unclassified Rhizobium]|jgi:hypothetical protein|uniref:hypothetical protein n=1 Tax=unclassified Rhizobium TaxID=2613769 RepID=UPI000DDA0DF6|nr:hypothetical protein [Rhizobium sp. BG4]QRM42669.1 hypothetical protein F2982_04065 [Rhizobium sp. BG4]